MEGPRSGFAVAAALVQTTSCRRVTRRTSDIKVGVPKFSGDEYFFAWHAAVFHPLPNFVLVSVNPTDGQWLYSKLCGAYAQRCIDMTVAIPQSEGNGTSNFSWFGFPSPYETVSRGRLAKVNGTTYQGRRLGSPLLC